MSESDPRSILVVANRTAATPTLLEEVGKRAAAGPIEVTLLVPAFPTVFDPEALESRQSIELAVPLIEQASGGRVKAILGDPDAFKAVRKAVQESRYDEVIISTLPARVSRWLKRDLPRRVEQLGVPVTVVTAPPAARIVTESIVRQTP
jgi:hypothetical protein